MRALVWPLRTAGPTLSTCTPTSSSSARARVACLAPERPGDEDHQRSTKGLAALVKAITTAAVDASVAPGLAAMDPAGAFIKQINAHQPGQPTPDQIWCAAITTNYEPDVFGGPGKASQATRLCHQGRGHRQADGCQERPRRRRALHDLGRLPEQYFKDVFNVPDGATTYHTTYFSQLLSSNGSRLG